MSLVFRCFRTLRKNESNFSDDWHSYCITLALGKERDPSNFKGLRDFRIQEKRETILPTRGGGSAHPGPLQNIIPILEPREFPYSLGPFSLIGAQRKPVLTDVFLAGVF